MKLFIAGLLLGTLITLLLIDEITENIIRRKLKERVINKEKIQIKEGENKNE